MGKKEWVKKVGVIRDQKH